jgi:type IV pilus assembly PilX-like protein
MAQRPSQALRPIKDEQGIALLIALMSTLLLTALGLALVMTTMTETMITGNYKDGGEAMYAADAGVERVMQDLLTIPDWNRILSGAVQSPFIDGAPSGTRTLPGGGGTIDLTATTNLLNCNKTTTCSVSEMNGYTNERPWTTNNPRWQLFAYAPLDSIIDTGTISSSFYVVVWIADDQSELDNDPTTDSPLTSPGGGVLLMRAEAFGPGGAHSVIEVTIGRTDTTELERGYTGQRGQDEQNRRARKAAVETPGKALTRSDMSATVGGFVTH